MIIFPTIVEILKYSYYTEQNGKYMVHYNNRSNSGPDNFETNIRLKFSEGIPSDLIIEKTGTSWEKEDKKIYNYDIINDTTIYIPNEIYSYTPNFNLYFTSNNIEKTLKNVTIEYTYIVLTKKSLKKKYIKSELNDSINYCKFIYTQFLYTLNI